MKAYLEKREERIRTRREKRKQGRLARLRRQIFRYVCLIVIFYVCCLGFTRVPWTIDQPGEDIKVFGNEVVSDEQVRRVLLASMQEPLYKLNPKQMASHIESLSCVHKAFVRRYLFPRPHLVVQVMEEFPWAKVLYCPSGSVQGVITQTGRFVSVAEFPHVMQPQLTVLLNPEFSLRSSDVTMWANTAEYISTQTENPVTCLDLRCNNDIAVQVNNLTLRLGRADSTLTKRLSRLSSVVPVVASLKENLEYVDLRLDSNVPLKVSKLSGHNFNL